MAKERDYYIKKYKEIANYSKNGLDKNNPQDTLILLLRDIYIMISERDTDLDDDYFYSYEQIAISLLIPMEILRMSILSYIEYPSVTYWFFLIRAHIRTKKMKKALEYPSKGKSLEQSEIFDTLFWSKIDEHLMQEMETTYELPVYKPITPDITISIE